MWNNNTILKHNTVTQITMPRCALKALLDQISDHLKSTAFSKDSIRGAFTWQWSSLERNCLSQQFSICPENNLRFPACRFHGEIYREYACAIYEYEYGLNYYASRREVSSAIGLSACRLEIGSPLWIKKKNPRAFYFHQRILHARLTLSCLSLKRVNHQLSLQVRWKYLSISFEIDFLITWDVRA